MEFVLAAIEEVAADAAERERLEAAKEAKYREIRDAELDFRTGKLDEDRLAALEAAKEAKYREIRDAELDYRMGKLSEEDWRESDRELRAQAMKILHDLDAAGGDARVGP